MEEGKFAAEFVTANLENILELGKKAFGKLDGILQLKLKTAYSDYLSNTRLKYSKSKSFFIRNQPVELYSYYVPTGIFCDNKLILKPSFRECTEFTNRIVISGSGGSGKSVLMKHLFLDCIREQQYAPILIELRDLNSYEKKLDDYINDTLGIYGFKLESEYITIAKKYGHFCFFFDGFDEVISTKRNNLIKQILSLAKKYPKCPIFLSSRPDDILNGIEDFTIFKMMPLSLNEALDLIKKLPYEEVIKSKFSSDLSSGQFVKHQSFLSNPLLLSIMLLTYGEYAEIPSKLSIFYNQAYESLFQRHDAYKSGYSRKKLSGLDIQDFSKLFSLFSLLTYEKRLIKMPRTKCLEIIQESCKILGFDVRAEDFLDDLLGAACLMIEDGLEITFSHRSFQEYFVAVYISSALPEFQKKLIDRCWDNNPFDNVISLLREINPELVERLLIVPRLDVLFDKIGLKKKVGITHLVKFLKYQFEAVYIEPGPGGISFAGSHRSNILSALLTMVVHSYASYSYPSFDENREAVQRIAKQLGDSTKRVEYSTKSLTTRSPLVKELTAPAIGIFSVGYLSSVFEAYKMLKAKHMNTVSSLDLLLGIK